jgi:serine/threonine protein kinase
MQKKQVPLSLKLRWVEQLFDAVQFIYLRSVLYSDISCNKIFLNDSLNIKLGDFAGSAIDDHLLLVCYETSYELPGEDISTRTELFALGFTTYEIMTGSKLYKDLPDYEVFAAFFEGRSPNLEFVFAFRNTIIRCWR